ncbi:hypothetical protein F3N42_03300 [Marinihelvus fidelis]|uniref:Uncharacterized protein n=1 Tax=Marinihelvus fidelis TaxID=2613842 RepID=A0A5N0TFX1_9GAMM|nr:hypothetical protein [Marinihelvus fidelis]KAA9133388.1 hypothetical protein F3N42_03300 [Marinihelvus fidelis]
MVIGDQFVWAHLGKAGGNSTHKMFEIIDNGTLIIDPVSEPRKHRAFSPSLEGKVRVLNFRRLHKWIASHNAHMARHRGLENPDEITEQGLVWWPTKPPTPADYCLELFEYQTIKHWIRVEFMANDFIDVVGRFLPISDGQKTALFNVHENKAPKKTIPPDNQSTLTKEAYERNPVWVSLEKRLYEADCG